jgi:replicative DNA helicase
MTNKIQQPPQVIDIEKAILGAAIVDSNCVPDILTNLFEDAFYLDAHKLIFKAIKKLYDDFSSIDLLTIVQCLKKNEQLETCNGIHYIASLTNNVVTTASIDTHIKILLEKYVKRDIIKISINLHNEAYTESTDPFEILDKADKHFTNTGEKLLGTQIKNTSFYVNDVLEQYTNVKEKGVLGITTGLKQFDKILCGLVAPDLIVIAARPGQGKTALALSITHNITIQNKIAGAWFSLEMDGTQLVRRLASMNSGVSHELIRRGTASQGEEDCFKISLNNIVNSPLYIEDKANITIQTIKARASILKRKHDIKYIVVDYLQLMNGNNKANRENEIAEISRGLKILAKELKIPIIALSQLSRECEKRPDKMPQLSDLRESGAIEQDADSVVFLMRPETYNMLIDTTIGNTSYPPQNMCIAKVGKNRHGECLSFAMFFEGHTMNLYNHPNDNFTPVNLEVPF